MKNINKSEVLILKNQVSYQEGQVVSKTLAQNDAVSVTLFAFDKGKIFVFHADHFHFGNSDIVCNHSAFRHEKKEYVLFFFT